MNPLPDGKTRVVGRLPDQVVDLSLLHPHPDICERTVGRDDLRRSPGGLAALAGRLGLRGTFTGRRGLACGRPGDEYKQRTQNSCSLHDNPLTRRKRSFRCPDLLLLRENTPTAGVAEVKAAHAAVVGRRVPGRRFRQGRRSAWQNQPRNARRHRAGQPSGSSTTNVHPFPSPGDSIRIRPPRSSVIRLQMLRPTPLPSVEAVPW